MQLCPRGAAPWYIHAGQLHPCRLILQLAMTSAGELLRPFGLESGLVAAA